LHQKQLDLAKSFLKKGFNCFSYEIYQSGAGGATFKKCCRTTL
jgi:hypothetical protein